MVSNEEISIRLAAKRNGSNPEELIQRLSKIEVPHEWINNTCIFDFGLTNTEYLANTIRDLFESWNYHLEEGNTLNGIYGRGKDLIRLFFGYFAFRYKFKVKIYSNEGKTFLEIFKVLTGIKEGIISGWQGLALYNNEFYRIINEIKYLDPLFNGYLVCDKCNEYYKLQPGESPYEFTDKCECGGNLEYYENIEE